MGQKINPHALRVGVIKDWDSKWYAEQNDYDEEAIETELSRIGKVKDWDAKRIAARQKIAGIISRISKQGYLLLKKLLANADMCLKAPVWRKARSNL